MKREESREKTVSRREGSGINIAGRTNKAIATNIGGRGEAQGTSSKQSVRIVQDGDVTTEESVTTVTRDSG
jgi:hypothetical protein